jgi:hypothetical protein
MHFLIRKVKSSPEIDNLQPILTNTKKVQYIKNKALKINVVQKVEMLLRDYFNLVIQAVKAQFMLKQALIIFKRSAQWRVLP